MAITPVPPVTATPPFPAMSDRAAGNYNSMAYAFGTHMPAFKNEIVAVADSAFQNASHAESRAQAASASASVAVAAIEAAEFMTGLTSWVSGKTYAKNEGAISLINGQTYIRMTAGGGSVDPANDTAGVWAPKFGNGAFTPLRASTATFNLSAAADFMRDVAASENWVFDKCPSNGFSFTVRLKYTGGTIGFPSTVKTPNNMVYAFTAGKTYELLFRTWDKGATEWLMSATEPYNS